MNRLASVLGIGIALAWGGAVIAHEGHEHHADKVMGTVFQVHSADVSHIEVKTSNGDTVVLTADSTTKYMKGKTAAALSDIKPGMHVVATVAKDGEVTKVSEIQIGTPAAPAHDEH